MSVIQNYKAQISQRDKKIQEMQADIVVTAETLLWLLKNIGIDPLSEEFKQKEVNAMALMSKAAGSLMSGKLSLSKLEPLMIILDKYKHLLPEQPTEEPKKGFLKFGK